MRIYLLIISSFYLIDIIVFSDIRNSGSLPLVPKLGRLFAIKNSLKSLHLSHEILSMSTIWFSASISQLVLNECIFDPDCPDELTPLVNLKSLKIIDPKQKSNQSATTRTTTNREVKYRLPPNLEHLEIYSCEIVFDLNENNSPLLIWPKLESLSLKENYFTGLDNFDKFPNLRSLDLSDNRNYVNNIDKPLLFGKLNKLEYLNLNNALFIPTDLYFLAGLTRLTHLNISNVGLNDNNLNDALRVLAQHNTPNLTHLDLSANNLRRIHVHSFAYLTKLKWLSLSRNKLRRLPEEGVFAALVDLETLDLSGNRLVMVTSPNKTFRGLERLRNLDLSENRLFFSFTLNQLKRYAIERKLSNFKLSSQMTKRRILVNEICSCVHHCVHYYESSGKFFQLLISLFFLFCYAVLVYFVFVILLVTFIEKN